MPECSDQLELAGAADRFAAVTRCELAEDALEVRLDGVGGDVHLAGDLGGAQHAGDMTQHLLLPLGQRINDQCRALTRGKQRRLVGIGALAIPGVGPFIAAGPIMAALAGLGVGGAVGGLIGALVGMGMPEYEAKRYEGRVKGGGTLLSVHCDTSDQVKRAKDLLKASGAEDIASTGEAAAAA